MIYFYPINEIEFNDKQISMKYETFYEDNHTYICLYLPMKHEIKGWIWWMVNYVKLPGKIETNDVDWIFKEAEKCI